MGVISAPLSAAPKSALLNGKTWLPSPLVPSGNRISASPAARRSLIASRCSAVLRTRRSTKTVRCNFASQPKNGQRATSALGDERTWDQRAEDRDVGVGDMVRREQYRPAVGRRADRVHAKAQDTAAAAVVEDREACASNGNQASGPPPEPASDTWSRRDRQRGARSSASRSPCRQTAHAASLAQESLPDWRS